MEAIHFGDPARPLFGLHHEPGGPVKPVAVLLCPGWGQEYMRAYRGLRTLAQSLAEQGFECLRFDYSGTGDSHGSSRDAGVTQWLADIRAAARELLDRSGADRLALVGHRSGALLAAEACRQGLGATSLLVLDAPAGGGAFVEVMRRLSASEDARKNRFRSLGNELPAPAGDELCGHAWPARLAQAMAALPAAEHAGLRWLHSRDHAPAAPADVPHWQLDNEAHWADPVWINSPWCPTPVLQQMARECSTWLS